MRLVSSLALTSISGLLLLAMCAPACSVNTEAFGSSESKLTTAACPVSATISQGFGSGHDGVDLAAPYDTPIYATGAGVVTDSGPAQGYGQWIRIRHDDGSMTEYGHMRRRDVQAGQRVRAGQQIALVGSEGQSSGPHLHLRVYRQAGDSRGIDPRSYLSARGISLPCRGGTPNGPQGTECAGGRGTVVGKIDEKYRSLGGCGSVLGVPMSEELGTADGIGRYNDFENGVIYWTEATGAHEVHGEIHALWKKLNWEMGPLGYPISDETATPDQRGKYSVFEHGSIYWTETTKAHEVRGRIRDKWKDLGWEAGALGYPTSDEYDGPGGRKSDFEHGSITWNAATDEATVALNEDADAGKPKDGGAD